ncbi:hypothetical protein B0H14DRAFT_2254838, partial [Mycena olivaceomarginata]
MLGSFAETCNYALLDGRRLTPTTRSKRGSAGSSLVQVKFNDELYVGEIPVIFRHKQSGVPSSKQPLLAFVAWMKPSKFIPLNDNSFIWNDCENLPLLLAAYALPNDPDFPPHVIPLDNIQCQVARGKIGYTRPPLWIITTMDR